MEIIMAVYMALLAISSLAYKFDIIEAKTQAFNCFSLVLLLWLAYFIYYR